MRTFGPVAAVLALACVAACSGGGSGPRDSASPTASSGTSASAAPSVSTTPAMTPPQATAGAPEVIATRLAVPWGVAFLPTGDALVSERDSHRILLVSPSGHVTRVGTVPGVRPDAGEGGLLGLAVSPDFGQDHLVYAYLTTDHDNRVVRFTYDGGRIGAPRPVFTGIPESGNHDGGRIAFGPDRLLYVTAGDALQSDRAQERSYLGGKVLRMTADGEPAPGNPFPGSAVYTYGHRNPEGLAWGPDGRLYEAEFGQDALDEINLLRPGRNYGWPIDEGTNGPSRPGLVRPLRVWRTTEASPSGLAYAGGSLWLATLQGQNVYRMPVAADGSVGRPASLFAHRWGRLRTVALAPDGSLWLTTSNRDGRGGPTASDDRIIRIPLR
jgi:glucose/arabinose dehydrogenase